MITTEQIKTLRDETGVSVMQCKKALEEAGGDAEKALIILRKKSGEIAAKKADRTLGAGVVAAYLHAGGAVGTLVELRCETDFVSGNEEFKKLAYDIAMHVAALNPEFVKIENVPEDAKAKVRGALAPEVVGKPADMQEKILSGKMEAFFKDKTLWEQPFVKNPEVTVGDLVAQAVQKFGERVDIARFARFSTR